MPLPRRHLKLGGLIAAVAVLMLALAWAGAPASEAGGTGSSFSNAPEGARAAFLTLRQLGYTVERSHEPLTAVAADPGATVLVLASPRIGISDLDQRALAQFIERGGVVLATGFGGARALGGRGVPDSQPIVTPEAATYHRAIESGLTAEAPEITLVAEVRQPALGDAYVRLYGPAEEPVVQAADLGEGRAVWWAGSTPLTNAVVADAGNFDLLLNILGDGDRAILWDEHYHGLGRSLWSYAAATPLPWLAAQAVLFALAAMVTWSRRPGPLRPRVVDPRTSPMEFVETMGGLYERAGVADTAVASARHRLRRLLASACGLGAGTPDEQLVRAAAARLDLDELRLAGLLRESERTAGEPLADREVALSLVGRLQSVAASIATGSARRRPGPPVSTLHRGT